MDALLRKTVNEVLLLLVAENYGELEQLTHGDRLSAVEIQRAISDYRRKIVLPPEASIQSTIVKEFTAGGRKRWASAMDLWTQEEGRSDLTLEMTFFETPNGLKIRLDDIHVL